MIFSENPSNVKAVLLKSEGWVKPYMGKVQWGHFIIQSSGVKEPGFRIQTGPDESISGPVTSILLIKQKS